MIYYSIHYRVNAPVIPSGIATFCFAELAKDITSEDHGQIVRGIPG
jgi:hypothetical protein